jgi:general stress protein 26
MASAATQAAHDYLTGQKTLTLATASEDGEAHASTFMYVNHGFTIYFWARANSTTAKHIGANPRVSLAIDEYVEDWNKARGIQADGLCELVSDGDDVARAIGLFADKFPSPSSGASTTNITFFKVTPTALHFIDNSGAQVSLGEDEFGMNFHREEVLSE